MMDLDFKLPPEYESLIYLHTKLGDIETVECVCFIWNKINGWQTSSTRVKDVNERLGKIMITGRCTNPDNLVMICKYLTSNTISIEYEKTIITTSAEV